MTIITSRGITTIIINNPIDGPPGEGGAFSINLKTYLNRGEYLYNCVEELTECENVGSCIQQMLVAFEGGAGE